MNGKLYLVPTPIGNPDDITLRALTVLRQADCIVCEEFKEGRALLRKYQIEKPLESLNEHNTSQATPSILRRLTGGESIALVSDCGTPVFSDPGAELVREAIARGVQVVPLPGASSLLPALVGSGFSLDAFVFVGWLSPKKDIRKKQLGDLKRESRTAVIMETPYRLNVLLRERLEVLGPARRVSVAFDLTLPTERFYRGTLGTVTVDIASKNLKGEFVVVIQGSRM